MAPRADAPQRASRNGFSLKAVSLITLTFQNSALILIMHYSRIMPLVGGHRYFTSTAVFLNEVLKLAFGLTIALYDISQTLPPSTPATTMFEQLYNSTFGGDSWKLTIPATLYTLQNSLMYIAVSNLDAVHFQILYQLKILTTALFSVTILGRSLSSKKWISLVLLTIGVAIVQLPNKSSSFDPLKDSESRFYFPRSLHELGQLGNGAAEVAAELTKRSFSEASESLSKRSATYEGIQEDMGWVKPVMSYPIGFAAVLSAVIISGVTGVYFEKVLKDSANVSIWTRNVQLSFYSLFPAVIFGIIMKDGEEIAKNGFFDGYNPVVWTTICMQALGGILVSMCINYADNIAKNFATSISIILSFVVSVWFFDFKITTNFVLGTAIVLISTYLYSGAETRRGRPSPINIANYEKTVTDNGFTPRIEEDREHMFLEPLTPHQSATLRSPSLLSGPEGLSTSRPTSPNPEKRHSRRGSGRGKKE